MVSLCVHRAGLMVALVERDDFASGTSSRSTKLIHGGVRYLQKAIMGLDFEQVNTLASREKWWGLIRVCLCGDVPAVQACP